MGCGRDTGGHLEPGTTLSSRVWMTVPCVVWYLGGLFPWLRDSPAWGDAQGDSALTGVLGPEGESHDESDQWASWLSRWPGTGSNVPSVQGLAGLSRLRRGGGSPTSLPRETPTPSACVVLTVTDKEPEMTSLGTPSIHVVLGSRKQCGEFSGSGRTCWGDVGTHFTCLSHMSFG